MSVRQYIGARYVTKIYENTLDPSSAEWQASVNYEPLTMVTYNYGSYLSKKQVPASVGNPADNPTYWVQTGFYNGQISMLQDQIDILNSNMNKFGNGRRVLVVTDSYGRGRGGQVPFTTPLQVNLGLSNDDYFALAQGAMGIVHVGEYGTACEDFIEANITSIDSPDTITDIVLALGTNDILETTADLNAAFASLDTYLKTTFPKAAVHVMYIGNMISKTSAQMEGYHNSISVYRDNCGLYKYHWVENIRYIMHCADYFISDNIHPTTAAGEVLASAIASALDGSDPGVTRSKHITGTGSGAGLGKVSACSVDQFIDNGILKIQFGIKLAIGQTISLPQRDLVEIATLPDTLINAGSNHAIIGQAIVFEYDGGLVPHLIDVWYYDNKIYYRSPEAFTMYYDTANQGGILIYPTANC